LNSNENVAEAGAQSADSARARVFLLRAAISLIALMAYQFSGASSHLLAGLQSRFGDSWWPVHLIYVVISLFGLGSLMLPLSIYEDFILDARETGEETNFEQWTVDILKIVAMDLLVGTAFFIAVYGLIGWLPRTWWIAAAAIYGLINCAMSIVPLFQSPAEDELGELRDPVLRERLSAVLKQSGLPDFEVLRWNGEGAREDSFLALLGVGKRRRVIISEALFRDFSPDEIAALLAHEAAHIRNADAIRMSAVSFAAAVLGFAAMHLLMRFCSLWFDFSSPGDLSAFPVLTTTLVAVSFAGLPLLNAYSRHREYVADAVAARIAGDIPLCDALAKLNSGGPAASPGTMLDLFLDSHPGLPQRLWRLRGGHRLHRQDP
jgi:STE24 endopeptidase